MQKLPTLEFETRYWKQGITLVAGIDEVGMGALAGPVVAAAVILKKEKEDVLLGVNDSKKLTEKKRESLSELIKKEALAWAIGESSVEDITEFNIRKAAHLAMRRAVDTLSKRPDMLLIDGTPAQIHPEIFAVNIIKGDSISLSIAGASIIAKVYRDNIMVEIDKETPGYGFSSNKGYGSSNHMQALRDIGPCRYHRPTYAPVREALDRSQ